MAVYNDFFKNKWCLYCNCTGFYCVHKTIFKLFSWRIKKIKTERCVYCDGNGFVKIRKKYKEIVKKIQDHREKTQVFLMLKDLDYVVKGGRLPSKIKTLANLLRLRPVLGSKKGKLTARGVLYGHRNRVEKFVNFLSKKINPEKKYHIMIAHANDYENGEKLLKLLIHNHSNILKHHLLELGGALGAHAGPGGLAVGIQERK